MPRPNHAAPKLPKLFKPKGRPSYYFRRKINGKDKIICAHTDDLAKAREYLTDYMNAEIAVSVEAKVNKSTRELATKFTEAVIGKSTERLSLDDAWTMWRDHTPEFDDIIAGTQNRYERIYKRFVAWCKAQEINYIDEVDKSLALIYAKHIWSDNITPRTFNDIVKFLSRIFETIDLLINLPNRNPFHHRIVKRKRAPLVSEATHQPLEPDMLKKVMEQASIAGQDFLDLFILGSQTGMRLKCAALLKWETVGNEFIEYVPYKTKKSGNTARVPISPTLKELLERRSASKINMYVLPEIANYYLTGDWVTKRSKQIFSLALGEENTVFPKGEHRKRNTSIYGFHSFRTTMMSLLAAQDVSNRDAMRMLGWESSDMIRVYEKLLERARGDSDRRAMALINNIEELKYDVPEVEKTLDPTEEIIRDLVGKYSNVAIGKIFDVSEAAVRKWLKNFSIVRKKRIESADIPEEEIINIRNILLTKQTDSEEARGNHAE